jgi:hypothetical protein
MGTRVTLTMNEAKRLHHMQKIVDQQMTATQAAELLGLSLRQVARILLEVTLISLLNNARVSPRLALS